MSELSVTSAHAEALLSARAEARLVPTPSSIDPDLTLADAYAVADEIRRLRIARGETPRGYKIGFTNRGIWDRYGVHEPIWAPIWDSTVESLDESGEASVSLAPVKNSEASASTISHWPGLVSCASSTRR